MELIVSPGLETVRWYGRGPGETYVDRAFDRVGIYSSTVSGEWVEYSRPQENGNKVDVRWIELTSENGLGLRAEGMPLLSVAARHAPKNGLEQSSYSFQVARHPEIYLNLDLRQMGVGGIDSWSRLAYPMEAYRISGNEAHSYRYRLKPIARRGPS
jgi:beta-galactosidase